MVLSTRFLSVPPPLSCPNPLPHSLFSRALALLEKSARAGHGPAAFRLGFLLSRGENGAARDPARAIAYFRAAASAREPEAFFDLGAAHASGRGLKRDYAEALAWLTPPWDTLVALGLLLFGLYSLGVLAYIILIVIIGVTAGSSSSYDEFDFIGGLL